MSDFDVVWSGGELLPPRDSVPDSRWQRIPNQLWEFDERPVSRDTTKARAALAKKRLYNKINNAYWKGRRALQARGNCIPGQEALQHRPARHRGSRALEGAGAPGDGSQCLSHPAAGEAATNPESQS